MPPVGQPPTIGFVTRVHRMPGHYVKQSEPVLDVRVAMNILTICAPVPGKIMRAKQVGDIIAPGDPMIEVTEVGTPTWELFIAYRRADSPGHAGHVGERLITDFGPGQVFKDIESLPPGLDFVDVVRDRLQRAVVMVVIIGPRWLDPRLNDPEDLHHEEIRTALQRGIHVQPVLVDGARMPRKDDLPEDIRPLTRRHAIEVSDGRWDYDMDRVSKAIAPALAASPRRKAFLDQVPPLTPGPGPQWIQDNPPLDENSR